MKKSRSRKEVIMEDKEKQWYIPPSHGIPTYNANSDPNCRVARIGQYNLQQKAKIESMADTDGRTAEWIKQKLSKTYEDIPIKIHVNLSSKAIDEAKYLPANGSGPSPAEVEILQKIVIRERLLMELTKLTRSSSDIMSVLGEVSELLKAIRFETLEIVESISTWQSFQPTPRPFLYKGMNYLLKVSCDLDFLDNHEEVIERFCFEFKSNPFAYRGGGNIITGVGARNSEQYLQGLMQSYRGSAANSSQTLAFAVDGIDIVRLHNGEKIIQAEFNRLAQQSNAAFGLHTSTEGLLLYKGSASSAGDNGPLTTGVLNTSQSSPQGAEGDFSQQYAPTSSSASPEKKHKGSNNHDRKSTFSFNPKKLKLERIATLEEEADELAAVIAHIKEQIDTLVDEYKATVGKRKQLERRQQEAVIAGRDLASQHLAAEIIVIKSDLLALTSKVRDLQREHYFVSLERRRKLGVVRTMKTEMDEEKRKSALKKRIEDTIKREGLGAALLLLNVDKETAMSKLAPIRPTPSSTATPATNNNASVQKMKKKSRKSSHKKKRKQMREKQATAMSQRSHNSTAAVATAITADDEDKEDDDGEDGDDEEEDEAEGEQTEDSFTNKREGDLTNFLLQESSQEDELHAEVAVDFDGLDLGEDEVVDDNGNAVYNPGNDRSRGDQNEEVYISSVNATMEDQNDVDYYLQLQRHQNMLSSTDDDPNNESGIDQGVSYISGDENDDRDQEQEQEESIQEGVAVGSGFSVAKALKSSRVASANEQQVDEVNDNDLVT